MSATLENDLLQLAEQERTLRFAAIDAEWAWRIGERLRDAALKDGLPVAFDVSVAGTCLLYATLPGAGPDNAEWIRRKKNVVGRFLKSSYAMKLELDHGGTTLEQRYGTPPVDFVAAGGAFPLRLVNCPLPVGTVTVSGLPMRQDHALVVRVLAEELGLDAAALALP